MPIYFIDFIVTCWGSVSSSRAWIQVGWRAVAKKGSAAQRLLERVQGNIIDEQNAKSGARNHAIPALDTIAMQLTQTMYPCEMHSRTVT